MRKGVIVGILVGAVLAILLVTAAILIAISFRSIGTGFIGLRYKTSNPNRIVSNSTYTSGLKWAGLGFSFHLYPIREIVSDPPVSPPVKTSDGMDILAVYSFGFELIAADLYKTFWDFGPWNSTVYRYQTIPYVESVVVKYNFSYLRTIDGSNACTDDIVAGFGAALNAIHANLIPGSIDVQLFTQQSS